MTSNLELWERLRETVALRFASKSHTGIGWSGAGTGVVEVSHPAPGVLIFHESGSWRQDGGQELRFFNVFRWTALESRIRLEHLRFGADNPVFLFDMAANADGVWREIHPHPCHDDCYRASLRLQ